MRTDITDTIITCAPFTVTHLLGDNIKLRAPPARDRRAMVKYTNFNGALHEFRCRTWVVSQDYETLKVNTLSDHFVRVSSTLSLV